MQMKSFFLLALVGGSHALRSHVPQMSVSPIVGRRHAFLTAAALIGGASAASAAADLSLMSDADVKSAAASLTPLQQRVLLEAATERAFSGETVNGYKYNNEKKGTYVSAISGVPLFSSSAKVIVHARRAPGRRRSRVVGRIAPPAIDRPPRPPARAHPRA
jgi:hypothetical protein